ncbi:juvenile hormone-binding protein-like [Battus philenor]|uniref:juvenile hormone-binding protein-like n=1 Tax=Battus philenor TaxID=42288 RepID=UPI0035CE8D27
MRTFEVFLLLSFSTVALSDGGELLRSCKIKDIECLSKSTEQFLEKTCKGIPSADIRPIDPLVIPSLNYVVPEFGDVSIEYNNLNISGLRNQKISDFQMDKETKSAELKVDVDLNIVGEITINVPSKSKSFSGSYSAKAAALATANYNYDLKVNEKGVRHFEVLPEKISCSIIGKPEVSLNGELIHALRSDENFMVWREKFEKGREEFQKKVICKMIEKAFVTVVHNLRAAAKFLPAEDFFQDI